MLNSIYFRDTNAEKLRRKSILRLVFRRNKGAVAALALHAVGGGCESQQLWHISLFFFAVSVVNHCVLCRLHSLQPFRTQSPQCFWFITATVAFCFGCILCPRRDEASLMNAGVDSQSLDLDFLEKNKLPLFKLFGSLMHLWNKKWDHVWCSF